MDNHHNNYVLASPWKRLGALLLDGIIFSFLANVWEKLCSLLKKPILEKMQPIHVDWEWFTSATFLVLIFIYLGWFYKNKGATPGKEVLKLKVVRFNSDKKIGYWRAFGRETLGRFISTIVLFIGYLMAFWRKDKRTLHDLIFDTLVIDVSKPTDSK